MALKRNVVQWDDALARVDPRAFEELIAEYYLRQGFRVEHAGAEAREQQRDSGVDLRLHRGGGHVVVQCKHWRVSQIMPNEIRDLVEVMQADGAASAIMITTGEFTDVALRVARAAPILLVDGREIREMLDRVAVQQAERAMAPRVAVRVPVAPAVHAAKPRSVLARPYLVPAMVLAGSLVATIGLTRSMAVPRHGPALSVAESAADSRRSGEAAAGGSCSAFDWSGGVLEAVAGTAGRCVRDAVSLEYACGGRDALFPKGGGIALADDARAAHR